jgi:hypothetical protein
MRDMRHSLDQQLHHVLVVEAVDDDSAAPIADDQTMLPKEAELVRHGGLLHPDAPGQLGHRAGPLVEAREQSQPAGRRERLHHACDFRRSGGVRKLPGMVVSAVTHPAKIPERLLMYFRAGRKNEKDPRQRALL